MANGVIVPTIVKDSGTTNITGITWVRSGDIVQVTVNGADISTQTEITGLPIPKNKVYVYAAMLNNQLSGVAGYVEYHTTLQKFLTARTASSGTMFGTFTYITE